MPSNLNDDSPSGCNGSVSHHTRFLPEFHEPFDEKPLILFHGETDILLPVQQLVRPVHLLPLSLPSMYESRRNTEEVPHRRQPLHRLPSLILLHLLRPNTAR